MRILPAFIASFSLFSSAGGKEINWGQYAEVLEPAHYEKQTEDFPPDYERQIRDDVIQSIVRASYYGDAANIDLLSILPKLKSKTEQERLKELNDNINHAFSYWSDGRNWWYAEPPALSLLIGGDCKAYAYFKYWALYQLGYRNIKLVTVAFPDGHGHAAGHVVLVLNDLWVLDINPPYYYPFEVLRAQTILDEAFFPDGTVWSVK